MLAIVTVDGLSGLAGSSPVPNTLITIGWDEDSRLEEARGLLKTKTTAQVYAYYFGQVRGALGRTPSTEERKYLQAFVAAAGGNLSNPTAKPSNLKWYLLGGAALLAVVLFMKRR